jgi:hypothetical protein
MKTSNYQSMVIAGILIAGYSAAFAGSTVLDGSRPLLKAAEMIELKTGIPVDYEDPEYLWEGDFKDVTSTVAKKKVNHRVLVPRGGPVVLTFSNDRPTAATGMSHAISVLQSALDQHHGQQLPGEFQVIQTGHWTVGQSDQRTATRMDGLAGSRLHLPGNQRSH